MKILYATSEAVPFCKTGGLADVAGSLPPALAEQGAEVAVVLPMYQRVKERFGSQLKFECYDFVDLAWRHSYGGLFSMEKDGVTWYFLDNEQYFNRPDLYGYIDDGERFGFFPRSKQNSTHNMRRTLHLLLLLILFAATAAAQEFRISGKAIDAKTKSPVEFASAALLRTDSTAVLAATTDEEGRFTLRAKEPGAYLVRLTFVGFTPTVKRVTLTAGTAACLLELVGMFPILAVLVVFRPLFGVAQLAFFRSPCYSAC